MFNECGGGLLESLSGLAPFRKRVLGIQKSRTRDNINKFNRCFGYIPALIEGSDPKSLKDIVKGDKQTYFLSVILYILYLFATVNQIYNELLQAQTTFHFREFQLTN